MRREGGEEGRDDDRLTFRCRHCGRLLRGRDEQPCTGCRRTAGMAITSRADETVSIREIQTKVISTLKRNYPWFLGTVIVTMAAPFITAFLNPYLGIIVGLGFGGASLLLGRKAYILLKRISS